MTTKELKVALKECLSRLHGGESLEACLQTYPDLISELRPLLETAASLRRFKVEPYSPEAFQAGRARLHAAIAERRSRSSSGLGLFAGPLRPPLGLAVVTAVTVLAFLAVITGLFGLRASSTHAVQGVVESVDVERDTWRISTSKGTIEVKYGPDTPVVDAQGNQIDPHDIAPGTSVRIEVDDDGGPPTAVEVQVEAEGANSGPGGGDDGNSGPGGGEDSNSGPGGGDGGDSSGPGGGDGGDSSGPGGGDGGGPGSDD